MKEKSKNAGKINEEDYEEKWNSVAQGQKYRVPSKNRTHN